MIIENTDFREEILDTDNPFDVKLVTDFLRKYHFEYLPQEVDYTMIVYNLNGHLIGTGSYQGKILKYIVVDERYRETTALPLIITHLTNIVLAKEKYVFVFTRPQNAVAFKGIGFNEIATAEPLFTALEMGYKSINDYVEYLTRIKRNTMSGNVAAIVVNCNPFTNGHLYLIEKAAAENELVYLFVVETELSAFPFETRWELISKGIEHLTNVKMVKGGEYIVSGWMFPSYFLKNESTNMVLQKQAELDVTTFAKYVVPTLGIKKRYVGTEVYCQTTAAYNRAMHQILPAYEVEVIEVTRKYMGETKENEPNFISASKVRQAIRENNLMSVIEFLPDSTKEFLLSPESWSIKEKIRQSGGRH